MPLNPLLYLCWKEEPFICAAICQAVNVLCTRHTLHCDHKSMSVIQKERIQDRNMSKMLFRHDVICCGCKRNWRRRNEWYVTCKLEENVVILNFAMSNMLKPTMRTRVLFKSIHVMKRTTVSKYKAKERHANGAL